MDKSPKKSKENKIVPEFGGYHRQRRQTLQDKRLEEMDDDETSEEAQKPKGFFNDFLPKSLTTKKTAPK